MERTISSFPFFSLIRLAFQPLFGSFIIVSIFIGLILATILMNRPRGDRLPRAGANWLVAIRIVSLMLLALALLRASVVFTEIRPLSASVFFLVDTSESMSVQDEIGEKSRYDAVKQALESAESSLGRLEKRCEVKAFSFDATTTPLELDSSKIKLPEKPLGGATAIGNALEYVQSEAIGKRLLATILLSDGTQRSRPPKDRLPTDAAARFRDDESPIFAVRLGKPGAGDTFDVALRDLFANEHVFVNNELTVSGQIQIFGFVNEQIPLKLFFETKDGDMKEIASKEMTITENGQIVPYQFQFNPETVGLFKLTVASPIQPKEIVQSNNELSTFVRVLSGGLKVLYIEGTRRYEQHFIRKSLDSSPDIHVDYLRMDVDSVLRQSQKAKSVLPLDFLKAYTADRQSLLETHLKPGQYNVFIIGDIDSAAFKPEELQQIKELVEKHGAGLMFLGGMHAFGSGGYGETPIEPLFPARMSKTERQPLGGEFRDDVHWNDPISLTPSELGKTHFLLRLAGDIQANTAIWENMPALQGANKLGIEKGGAIALLKGKEGQSILVSQLQGNGRVLALATDSTWRWVMAGFPNEHKRFWRQAVLWLAKMDDSMSGDCWIKIEKNRFLPGDSIPFQVFLQSKMGEILQSPIATAFVVKPDGSKEPVTLVDINGVPSGSFRMSEAIGDYTIHAEATTPSGTETPETKQSSARFSVIKQHLEMDNPVADPPLLESISAMSGGKTIAPEQLASLLDEIGKETGQLSEKRETKRTLYDTWTMLIGFVLLMSTDWLLRKRWGLV